MTGGAAGRPNAAGRRRAVQLLSGGAIVVAAMAAAGVVAGLRINLTPSAPIGLWRIVPLDRPAAVGDLALVCPPAGEISAFGLERGYFRRGSCPGGAAPLIKTIVAIAGARIEIGANVAIDHLPLPGSRLSSGDGRGRSLSPWPGGVIPPGHVFLHASFAGSYDSRYFGPVPETGVLGLARPVFTVDP